MKGSFAGRNYSFLRLSEYASCLCTSLNERIKIENGFIIHSFGLWELEREQEKSLRHP